MKRLVFKPIGLSTIAGLHSAMPRYTPAYALTAPNGVVNQIFLIRIPLSNKGKWHLSHYG